MSMSLSVVDNIGQLVPRLKEWRAPEMNASLGLEFAQALGWTAEARVDPVAPSVEELWLAQGSVSNQPAVIFAASWQPNGHSLVDSAALFAYHASIEWGVLATSSEMLVFNSHWIRKGDWYQLPPINWDDHQAHSELFQAITPDGLTTGQIDKLATRYYKPDKLLVPVDNALVERLDYWRSEALRHSHAIEHIDEKLQILFAQLFILRAIEDRDLAPDLPRLEDISNQFGELDLARLDELFGNAQNTVQSDLFDDRVYRDFPSFVLTGIVRDLYVPSDLSFRDFRYNFSWIHSDVLGSAYEKYLSNVLVPIPKSSLQLSLFEEPLRDVHRVSVRKKTGVFYTPRFLVSYLTERALDCYYTTNEDSKLPRIADFTCGSGSFLTTAVGSLIRRLRQVDSERNWGREIIEGNHIVGIDNDKRAVTLARLSLWLRLAEEPDPLPLPHLQQIIIHGDSLSENTFTDIPASYDIVLGNPPFIATGKIPGRKELAERFRTAQGRYDYSYLFLELAIDKLEESGFLAMVVPNRLFRNRDAKT